MRERGYYWLRFKEGDWFVGEYGEGLLPWSIIGSDNAFSDDEFAEIGAKINLPVPDCVQLVVVSLGEPQVVRYALIPVDKLAMYDLNKLDGVILNEDSDVPADVGQAICEIYQRLGMEPVYEVPLASDMTKVKHKGKEIVSPEAQDLKQYTGIMASNTCRVVTIGWAT